MPKGYINHDNQLDALAATIVGAAEVKRIAKKQKISKSGLYHLARAAIKRLSAAMDDTRALETITVGKPSLPKTVPMNLPSVE